jgi:hypothetical protein
VDYGEGSAENVARGYDSYLAVGMDVPYGLAREGKALPYQYRRQEDPGSELHRHVKDVP